MKFQKKKQPVKPSRKNIVLKSEIRGGRRTQEISAQSRFKHSFIKNLFTSTDRTGRSEYWLFCLSSWTTGITTGLIFTFTDKTTTSRLFFFTFFILWTVMTLTGATIRRYHDTGLSGWHLLLSAASVIFFYLVLFIPFYLTNQEERYLFKKACSIQTISGAGISAPMLLLALPLFLPGQKKKISTGRRPKKQSSFFPADYLIL